jgi:hypothetical protein
VRVCSIRMGKEAILGVWDAPPKSSVHFPNVEYYSRIYPTIFINQGNVHYHIVLKSWIIRPSLGRTHHTS